MLRSIRFPTLWAAGVAAVAAALLAPVQATAQVLQVGVIGASSDAPFFIAEKKGFFKDEGITVNFIRFDSAAKAIAPLGTGELDVASGATSAGLYNAVKRGIGMKVVGDKAKNAKGHGFQALMVRKDLIDSGKVKSLKDFKGLKVAISAVGNSEHFLVDEALRKAGLAMNDIERVYLGFPQHIAAFQNGAIDASLTVEPTVSAIVKNGTAVRFLGVDEFYPDYQTAVTFYSDKFIKEKPEQAEKFLRALIRAARFYNDALQNGKLTGPGSDEVLSILTEFSHIKDPAIFRSITSHYFDPDGGVNLDALKQTWEFFRETKQIDGSVTVDQVVDMSFAKKAAASLGPYKKKDAATQ
jgi:NitT/TauT family transport system substrate-binding protein